MSRILNLQALEIDATEDQLGDANSSSSDHNCACSTASAAGCIIAGEFMAI